MKLRGIFVYSLKLFNDKILYSLEERICLLVTIRNYGDGREGIKCENSHYRLCIYYISSLLKVNLVIEKSYLVYKASDVLNAFKRDLCLFHIVYPPKKILRYHFSIKRTSFQ